MSTPWTCPGPRASAAMTATSDESMPPDRAMATAVEQPLPEDRQHLDVADGGLLLELGGACEQLAVGVEHHGGPVEHQLVLPTHLVDVDQGARRVRRPGGQHALALGQPVGVVGRGVDVDHQLGATGGLGGNRPRRAERVLADRHAQPHAANQHQRRVAGARCEVALLVEHGVVGQEALVVHGPHGAVGAHGGRVVQVAPGVDETHHGGAPAAGRRHPVECGPVVGDEPGLEQQVFGWIPGERQLWEHREVAFLGLGLGERGDDALDVAVEAADRGVDLAQSDAEPGHDPSVRATGAHDGQTQRVDVDELVERSADPGAVRSALSRFDGACAERIAASPALAEAVVATVAASRSATRLLQTDPAALDVLADLDAGSAVPGVAPGIGYVGDVDDLVRGKRLEQLRITARDLLGLDSLEATTAALADLATDVLRAAVRLAGAQGDDGRGLAVVGMGKLGGRELNYASDVDVLFVEGDARQARTVLDIARRCFRVDANLRPEGRDGALTRSVDSYVAYWDRWAQPWEFQALLKAVPVAGDPEAGRQWASAAAVALWGRRVTADDLPSDRAQRRRIARVLGFRGTPASGPTEAFDRELARQRNVVRTIHERLYFRPLLDALAGAGRMSPDAAANALASFGFADAERTRQAVRELTRGLTRSSRMMQQLLPLLLDWLSTTPDPDLGLLGLRKLASGERPTMELAHAFRDSPEVARRLCQLLGTSGLVTDILVANPDLIVRLADPVRLQTLDRT